MKTKIKNLASVQMGYSFRSRIEPDQKGNVSVIQMKDLTDDNLLDNRRLVQIELTDFNERHIVKRNDLVFRSRGQTNTAALINSDCATAVIAAPLIRLRVENNSLLPSYLCWFINQPTSQMFLQSQATGTAMRMIGKPALEELEIILPSLETQKHIVDLAQLSQKEQRLMSTLINKKRQLMSRFLMDLATTIQ